MGSGAAFISAGGYHHHIGLNTWESKGGHPPPPGTTGLFHTAILYPTRPALADALHRVLSAGIPLDGASDHGVSEALYLRDPDENGVELYWDRPKEAWPRAAGRFARDVHEAAGSGGFAAAAGSLTRSSLRGAKRRSNPEPREYSGLLRYARDDDACPRIMISTAAVSSSAMQQ